jgi:thymidylate kinase
MENKGLFVTFEGPDGSGKTTQIHKLADELEEQQIPFILTREPGGTEISDKIRAIILNPENLRMEKKTEILLYAASRSQHVEEKIRPALAAGKIVLCDRFVDASIAYQGYGLEQPVERIRAINQFATGGLTPDRTYLIDVPPETGRQRMRHRTGPEAGVTREAGDLDRIEQRALDYHARVREGFFTLSRENKQRILLVDGQNSPETVFKTIRTDFMRLLNRKAGQTD